MRRRSLLHNLTAFAWKLICQQSWLLAVLSMLFLILPLCVGPVADSLLKDGVDLSGIKLAVCVPDGDNSGVMIEEITGKMRDISRYASLKNMSREEAMKALEAGEITAVLLVPENFVNGILYGDNPDVTVVVREDQPMESLLTLMVGQSAADLLSAAQKGIYTVLEIAEDHPGEYSEDQIIMQVNLAYIRLTLNRQDFFDEVLLKPTGAMDISTHYGLSLIIFLIMTMPAAFCCLFTESQFPLRRRLRSIGCGAGKQLVCNLLIVFVLLFAITLLPTWILTEGFPIGVLILALFGSVYCSMCCLMTRSVAGCGGFSLITAAVCLFLSGGVLPTPLLPEMVRKLGVFSPAAILRNILYYPADEWGANVFGILLWILLMIIVSWLLFSKKLEEEGTDI